MNLLPIHRPSHCLKHPKMMQIQDSSFEMGCYTTRDYFVSMKAHADFQYSSVNKHFHRQDILVEQDEEVDIQRLLVAANMANLKELCHNMRHLFQSQNPSSSVTHVITITANSKNLMDIHIHVLHCGPFMFNTFDSIFFVVDQITKMTTSFRATRHLRRRNYKILCRQYLQTSCLLNNIIFDRIMQVTLKFWQSLLKLYGWR